MLVELSIKDVALIDYEALSFTGGLNVISGETGTGKSTILHALELILGAKPKPHAVREGATQLEVQALFSTEALPPDIRQELPDVARTDELLITRIVGAQGRGKVYINGSLATLPMVEQIASRLVTLCGQSSHVRLLSPATHLSFIDRYVGNEEILEQYREVFRKWNVLRGVIEEGERGQERALQRIEVLNLEIEELSYAKVRQGQREELEQSIKRLSQSEKILENGQRFSELFHNDEGVFTLLKRGSMLLLDLEKHDDRFSGLDTHLEDALSLLTECDLQFHRLLHSVEVNDELLESCRGQLADLARLERKYKASDEELASRLESAQNELLELEKGTTLADAKLQEGALRKEVTAFAKELRRLREDGAKEFTALVKKELIELSMKGGTLLPQFIDEPLSARGGERCEFFFSANKGEAPRPLREIASGGELSRLTLVLKKVLRDGVGVNVLVFDEVDVGVSGQVARAVGTKLKELSLHSQVVCITHLPQVASLADTHFLVRKEEGERTRTRVQLLSFEERVDEVARMISGFKITKAAKESARELLSSHLS
jgi:DNA repair protein RecN (Recombination protein N)